MIDPELKKALDVRLIHGEIAQSEYDAILKSLTQSFGRVSSDRKTPYATLESGFSVRSLEPGSLLRNRYEIQRLIGRGGMGVVYRAHDRQLGRDVALKVLPWEIGANAEAYDLLRKEANIAMDLHNERIMAIHGLDSDGETAFLVMELINGPTLSKKLLAGGSMSASEVIRIGIECCEALAYAHGKKVLHRDIKPQNIMLTHDGHVKICDFGLATELRSSLSRVSGKHVSGTPLYMPPEQLDAEPLDERADIYALCMTLYECLAGKHPWIGAPDTGHLVHSKIPPAVPGAPDGLMELVMIGVSKNKTTRPKSAAVILDHLTVLQKSGGHSTGGSSIELPPIGDGLPERSPIAVAPPTPTPPQRVPSNPAEFVTRPVNTSTVGNRNILFISSGLFLVIVLIFFVYSNDRPDPNTSPRTSNNGMDVGESISSESEIRTAGKYFIKKNYSEALVHYKRASDLAPNDGAILDNIAYTYMKMGQWSECLNYATRASELASTSQLIGTTRRNMAYCLAKLNRTSEACSNYSESLIARENRTVRKECEEVCTGCP